METAKAMLTHPDTVASRLHFSAEFAAKVDDILTTGTTVMSPTVP